MNGKQKCKALKEIRKQIAENNDISYVVEECKHKGECKGTCPKCEAEVRYLERELEKKRLLGSKIAVAGVSLGIAASFSACSPTDMIQNPGETIVDFIDDVVYSIKNSGNPTTPPDYAGGMTDGYELSGDVAIDDTYYENDDEDSENEDCDGEDCEGEGAEGIEAPELEGSAEPQFEE